MKATIGRVYLKAIELGLVIHPHQRNRLDSTRYEHLMNDISLDKLTRADMERYLDALWCIWNENAGGYDGWSGAIEKFKELGAIESEVLQGHRTFVSVSFEDKLTTKPE